MFWGNKRTKVAHYQQCRFAGSKADPNWIPFMTIDDVRAAGYKLCGICSPLAKDYRRFQNEYQDVCQRESLSLYLENGELYVVTPISMWHVRPGKNRKYELLHRNTVGEKDKYHLQRTFSQNVHNVLDYIIRHEKYRYNHPLIESHGVSRGKKRRPQKGSKRYRQMQRRHKANQRSQGIKRVLQLLDKLSPETPTAN